MIEEAGMDDRKTLYVCDRRRCERCSYPICSHTPDIAHAKNFVLDTAGRFVECDPLAPTVIDRLTLPMKGNEKK